VEEELEEPEPCDDYFSADFRRLTALDFSYLTLNESTQLFADRAPLYDCSTRTFPRTCYTLARSSHESQSDEPVCLNYAICYECDFPTVWIFPVAKTKRLNIDNFHPLESSANQEHYLDLITNYMLRATSPITG
jgi:hypothetical protein